MNNSDMILRLFTDLKTEQQVLRDTLKKIQSTLAILEKKRLQANYLKTLGIIKIFFSLGDIKLAVTL